MLQLQTLFPRYQSRVAVDGASLGFARRHGRRHGFLTTGYLDPQVHLALQGRLVLRCHRRHTRVFAILDGHRLLVLYHLLDPQKQGLP